MTNIIFTVKALQHQGLFAQKAFFFTMLLTKSQITQAERRSEVLRSYSPFTLFVWRSSPTAHALPFSHSLSHAGTQSCNVWVANTIKCPSSAPQQHRNIFFQKFRSKHFY